MFIRFEGRDGCGIYTVLDDVLADRSGVIWLGGVKRRLRKGDERELNECWDALCKKVPGPGRLVCAQDSPSLVLRFWFRDSATDVVRCAWRALALLRRYGEPMRVVVRHRPGGRIIYRDAVQVAILSKADVPRRRPTTGWSGDRTTYRRLAPCGDPIDWAVVRAKSPRGFGALPGGRSTRRAWIRAPSAEASRGPSEVHPCGL